VVVLFVFAPSSPIIFKMMRLCSFFVLSSGRDQLLPSEEEGQRLNRVLPKCQNRSYSGSGHFLLLVKKKKVSLPVCASKIYRVSAVAFQFVLRKKWYLCSILAGRCLWFGNNHQRFCFLSSGSTPRLCFGLCTTNSFRI
jgi:hypothetical protein